MTRATSRRAVLGSLGVFGLSGCLGRLSGDSTRQSDQSNQADDSEQSDPPDPLEKGGLELAEIEPEPLESYVGISAVVYNDTAERKTATVRFTAYDSDGNQLHQGIDRVSVDAGAQVPVSKHWKKDPDDSSAQGWDAKIVAVS